LAFSTLIIGYGSIGKRHTDILNKMNEFSSITVLTSQKGLPFETITSLEDITALNPDYLVVSSSTSQHYSQLEFIEENLKGKKIIMEKPLFEEYHEYKIKNNHVYVGYNLRFHPMVKKIREFIYGKKLWIIQIFCGSYLPDWRPERDYRRTSSANKTSGGGVLLDLSHELDLVQLLAGSIDVKHAVNENVSNLEIDSDDLLLFSGKTEGGSHVHISLNYFTRKPLRQIIIEGDGISIRGDIITNTLSVVEDGIVSDYSWPDFERNETYIAQHRAVIEDDHSIICTYEEGLETMRLVENIRSFGKR